MTRTKTIYLALLVLLSPMAANAVVINVLGTDYDVLRISGSFEDNEALLVSQPWWGSAGLAYGFSLESPDNGEDYYYASYICPGVLIPFTACDSLGGFPGAIAVISYSDSEENFLPRTVSLTQPLWAYVRVAPVSEPTTLALLGLGLVGMAARRKRQRH